MVTHVVRVLAVMTLASVASASLVDFESVPGGTPAPSLPINTQYAASEGMAFKFSDGTFPILEEAGSPPVLFNSSYGDNTSAPGQNTGQFFLGQEGAQVGNPPPPDLIVTYALPVSAASGLILDIDQHEAWTIYAIGSGNAVLGTITLDSDSPNAGDGLATTWSFIDPSADILAVRIAYTGETPSSIGWGWDNFSTGVPEPDTIILALMGLLGFVAGAIAKWARISRQKPLT